jgi:hypothetical protein
MLGTHTDLEVECATKISPSTSNLNLIRCKSEARSDIAGAQSDESIFVTIEILREYWPSLLQIDELSGALFKRS